MSHRKKNYHVNRCSFCHRKIEGLPHKCKYCGKIHCHKHLLPEDHGCKGVHTKRDWNSYSRNPHNARSHAYEKTYSSSWTPTYENQPKTHHRSRRGYKRAFRLPRIRISNFWKALIMAMASFFLASYVSNELTLLIEFGAWSYFAAALYKKAFRWANRVSMADDFAFWGLRIIGVVVVLVGMYLGFFTLLAAMFVRGSAPTAIPLFVLLAGLILLGLFIAFRTNRRYHVVGMWRA